MDRVKFLITAILIGSSIITAGLSASANCEGKNFEENAKYFSGQTPERDSEFWDKFRDSVMPDKENSPHGSHGTEHEPRERGNEPRR